MSQTSDFSRDLTSYSSIYKMVCINETSLVRNSLFGIRSSFNSLQSTISPNDILQEIDLNSTDINDLKSNFLLNGPQSLIGYHFISNFMQWLLFPFYKHNEDEHWSDAAVLNVYCPKGKIEYGIVVAIAEYKNGRIFLMLHCTNKNNFLILKEILMKTKVINWNKSLTFEGVETEFLPFLKEVLSLKNISIFQQHKKDFLVMPLTVAEKIKLLYPGEKIYVDRVHLKNSYINLINYNWDEKGENTDFLVETLIRNNRAVAVYLRDDADLPQAWAFRMHYGGIGIVNSTHLKGFERSRKFVRLVIQFLTRYSVIDGIQPFSCVNKDHVELIETFIQIGFEKVSNLIWITTKGETGFKYKSYMERA